MEVYEMTNEELANSAEEFANAFNNKSDKAILHEISARLRNQGLVVDQYRADQQTKKFLKAANYRLDINVSRLRTLLKDAEEALTDALEHVEIRKNNEYDDDDVVASCDKTISRCRSVLAAIRAEGGAK